MENCNYRTCGNGIIKYFGLPGYLINRRNERKKEEEYINAVEKDYQLDNSSIFSTKLIILLMIAAIVIVIIIMVVICKNSKPEGEEELIYYKGHWYTEDGVLVK